MRGEKGKSVPVLKEFRVEAILAPVTPEKPVVPNGQALTKEVGSSIHCAGVANQAKGWTPIYKPTPTRLSESTSKMKETDPSSQWRCMTFSDLLALNHGLATPVGGNQTALMSEIQESMRLRGTNKTPVDLQGWNQCDQDRLRTVNRRTEIQRNAENALPNGIRPTNACPHGSIPVFAPPTPDHRKRLQDNAAASCFPADMHPNKKNGEDSQVSVIHDLLGIKGTQSATDSIPIESYDPDPNLDLSKPIQQKPRRKKHRPKVVSEAKPKQTPNQRTPKPPTDANETPRQTRTYVRRNKTNIPSTTPPEKGAEALDSKNPDPAVKSCRKSLNFDLEVTPLESEAHSIPHSTEVTPSKHEFNAATEYISGRKRENLTAISLQKENSAEPMHPRDFFACSPKYSTCASSNEGKHISGMKRANSCSPYAPNMGTENVTIQCTPSQANYMFLGNAIFSCTHGMYFPKINKKRRTEKVLKRNTSHILSFTKALESIRAATSLQNYPRENHGIYFPEIRKKRRTEKVSKLNTSHISSFTHALQNIRATATSSQNYPREAAKTSKYYSIPVPHFDIGAEANSHASAVPSHRDNTQFINWGDIDKLNKRFIAPRCVHDLDSQEGFEECKKTSRSPAKGRVKCTQKKNLKTFNKSCMEAYPKASTAKQHRRRSRKKNSAAKSVASSFYMVNNHSLHLLDDHHFTRNSKGRFLALPWINTNNSNVDAIIEGMKQLSINREGSIVHYQEQNTLIPYHVQNQQINALVLYQRAGVIIPFEGTQSSKRHSRAKVDLDDETNRVWKLLLEDINNQGIDGTDEEKTKWWEEERNVFRGRVDSFIARMRLVQGDRRFSPWKGSVVDSVVGVFLTQNVSDHLSSSAYMSLAARYPLKSANKDKRDSEEEVGPSVEEPGICIVELDDNSDRLTVNEKTVEGHICNTDVSEEIDDVTSSQHSVIYSQNSVESFSVTTSGKMGLSSDNSSEEEDPTNNSNPGSSHCSASFVELLKLAVTPKLIDQVSSCQSDLLDEEGIVNYDKPSQKAFRTEMDSFSDVPNKCSTIYQPHPVEEYHLHSVDEESRSVNSTKLSENLTTEPRNATSESETEFHLHKKASKSNLGPSSSADNVCLFYVLDGEEMGFQSPRQTVIEQENTINPLTEGIISPQMMNVKLPTISIDNVATESISALNSALYNKLEPTLPLSENNYSSGEAHKGLTKDAAKKKTGKNRKKASFEWDSLRKQAQPNGRASQRTANTMDSIDWEAVRCADVNEIAYIIRERGMNNMLAERIKEFLDRVVNDHGNIDLEWLRDVPPDKAKEYLLSIKGLGLKSVECVRLLTLHHLAFPVDTNVGRIAVRLGWVPLQPLPESLQLHLLELYPVLESIQKYLWPRLCKLDQKTLYELHYHMITFGKVFCTKRQPNCNACPLRGECRHFASAFASARLALPAPQDRSILLSDQSNMTHQDPQVTINSLPMPLLMADQTLETKSEVRNWEPIVEIPASPEPEQIQTSEWDIEDAFSEDPNEIPTIKLNMDEFTQTLQAYMQSNKELQEGDMSKALVALATEAASMPTPKLKNVSRLRTEHHVYELPDTHQLLRGLDKREPDDPCPYLLAIWSPGETANSTEAPEKRCNFEEPGQLCSDETCFCCNSQREANSQIVRGTLLIPCRTAMRGSFPLNGTYFQVNEVFADQDSSLKPIQVPRALLWNLPRRTVYFGTSIPTIFKGLSTEGIQHCFWRGYVCVRGFDQKTRAPRPLMARLHFPASKSRAREKNSEQDF